MKTGARGLAELGRLYRLVPGYEGMDGAVRRADREAVLRVLTALGAELGDGEDVGAALRARHAHLAARHVAPVTVAWSGNLPALRLRLPPGIAGTVTLHLRLESGEVSSERVETQPVDARPRHGWRATHVIRMPRRLPLGYHVLTIETSAATFETFVIAAPRNAWAPAEARSWGIFCPLYSLWSDCSWGIGDYSDLERAARWSGGLGADFIATLPLLATFLDAPFEPSPYSPASRLFWNEVFIDVAAAPGWTPAAPAALQHEIDACRAGDYVDYRAVAALKRRELERARRASGDSLTDVLRRFRAAHPRVQDYARFRATCDRRREPWPSWPARLRAGELRDGDFAPEDVEYHIFAQWLADQQLGRVAAARRDGAAELYLDMPLGVNPDSYDAWRFQHLFADGVSAGAPPDPLFTGGQDWGFRPLLPAALRADRYAYFVAALRHHFRHARLLRLDHVMGLYRLFWVPGGMPATRGVYVRYPDDELFAVLVLESARHQAVVIGEDLGTVPPAVRRAMRSHNVHRMHVVQFEASPDREPPVNEPPQHVVASLNTHDMPTFAGFWRGSEIDDQLDLGLLDQAGHAAALQRRVELTRRLARFTRAGAAGGPAPTRDGLLERLAAGAARYVLLNIEDLWLEERPQNVPGTADQRPNWKRRAQVSLADIARSESIARSLSTIDRLRARPRPTD